jgi:hypothetical protein
LERRPDIRQAEEVLVAANAQIGAAKALYFPMFSSIGVLGLQSEDLKDFVSASADLVHRGRHPATYLQRGPHPLDQRSGRGPPPADPGPVRTGHSNGFP